MTHVRIHTESGAVISAVVEGEQIVISQDDHWAGTGRVVRSGGAVTITDCDARLGADAETEDTYAALEAAIQDVED